MNIYSAAKAAAQIGVHKNTVKAWSLNGKLPDRRTPVGHRYDTEADGERYLGVESTFKTRQTVVYGRVSRRFQEADLQLQPQALEAFCLGAGLTVDAWLTEMGGGLDCQQPVFSSLMERVEQRMLGLLPVAHQDRLCRIGCEIRVVNQPSLSPQAEWVEDLMLVMQTFSGRLPGVRRYRKQIREAAVDG
ncbi:MAG: IS607 family transposase [Caldilineaceae bacterium SB0666_bin_21]|nr:IS607 family transposase [Caldilineaceae bacterium SB0666_bin_21]